MDAHLRCINIIAYLDVYKRQVRYHPKAEVLSVAAPGGAARDLAAKLGLGVEKMEDVDFSRMFHDALSIAPNEPRTAFG